MKKLSDIFSILYPSKLKRKKPLKDEKINPFGIATLSSGNIMMGNLDKNGNLKLSLI